jgi:hypothetical protein
VLSDRPGQWIRLGSLLVCVHHWTAGWQSDDMALVSGAVARLLVRGAIVAAPLVAGPAAQAQSVDLPESARDVTSFSRADDKWLTVRQAAYPDLTSTRVVHTTRALYVIAHFRVLRPRGVFAAGLTVQTPEKQGSELKSFDVIAEEGVRDGYLEPLGGVCREPIWRINYARDTYRIRVPRGCFNKTEWVQVAFSTSASYREQRSLIDVAGTGPFRGGIIRPTSDPIFSG